MGECISCGWELDGSDYTLPWEDGDNECGYWTCRHCGCINEDYSNCDD